MNPGVTVLSRTPSKLFYTLQPGRHAGGRVYQRWAASSKPSAPMNLKATEGMPCSFTPQTVVASEHGEQPIGKLHVGERVLASSVDAY